MYVVSKSSSKHVLHLQQHGLARSTRLLVSTSTITSTSSVYRTHSRMMNRSFGIMSRDFTFTPKVQDKPKLILIGGCTGTGKSTFGMSVALDQDILKCISTDTIRAVMRSFIGQDISPALHRSSYTPAMLVGDGKQPQDDPVRSWRETCTVLQASIEGLVDDAIHRGMSLVVEGVHVVPSKDLIQTWEAMGGVATGCLLTIQDVNAHKRLLNRRGDMTGVYAQEQKKIQSFDRVRLIQEEMIRLAQDSDWLLIEQKLEPDPLELVATRLWQKCKTTKTIPSDLTRATTAQNELQPQSPEEASLDFPIESDDKITNPNHILPDSKQGTIDPVLRDKM